MLLAFDPNCAWVAPYNGTIDTTSCLALIYDTNGFGKPNIIGKDISLLNATLNICTGTKIGALCVDDADTTYTKINTCTDKTYDSYLTANTSCANNAWAGAKKACMDKGMKLPSQSDLNTMYQNYLTGGNTIGMSAAYYWSDADFTSNLAWNQYFVSGNQYSFNKTNLHNVRCVK